MKYELSCAIKPGWDEPASPRENHGRYHTKVHNPSAAALIGFAAQAKPVRFKTAGASAHYTLPFGFNPGELSTDRSLIGRGEMTTPLFIGPFCW